MPFILDPLPPHDTRDRVELFQRADRQWSWRVRAANGRIVHTAGEGFTRRWSARRAARRNHPGHPIVVIHEAAS